MSLPSRAFVRTGRTWLPAAPQIPVVPTLASYVLDGDSAELLSERMSQKFGQILTDLGDDSDDDDLLVSSSSLSLSCKSKKKNNKPQQLVSPTYPMQEFAQQQQVAAGSETRKRRHFYSDSPPPPSSSSDAKLEEDDSQEQDEKRRRKSLDSEPCTVSSNSALPAPRAAASTKSAASAATRTTTTKRPPTPRFHPLSNLPKVTQKPMTYDEQETALSQMEGSSLSDRFLQKLLYQAQFRFDLFPHQFVAVRRAAGVPHDFPLHSGSRVDASRSVMAVTMKQAIAGLPPTPETKGLCVADSMGLGKTVEAIAGAILSQEIAAAQGQKKKPILIVSPNDAVQIQWRDTLLLNGVPIKRIVWFKKGQTTDVLDTNNFVLLTRHTAAAEFRAALERMPEPQKKHQYRQQYNTNDRHKTLRVSSPLFPNAPALTLKRLQQEYLFDKGKGRTTMRKKGEIRDDTITRIVADCQKSIFQTQKLDFAFRMMIIDEAHFLKNRVTFWTFACALSSVHAWRSIPLTGTPYNNGIGDLATIMCIIDPSKILATTRWWTRALSATNASFLSAKGIQETTQTWHKNYMLRRGKETIAHLLPPKIVAQQPVFFSSCELHVYSHYELNCAQILADFNKTLKNREGDNPLQQARLKNMFQILMALMSCMRSSLIHPLLPANGREVTKRFSPTRCHLVGEQCPKVCVCCHQSVRPSLPIAEPENGHQSVRPSLPIAEPENGAPDKTKSASPHQGPQRKNVNIDDMEEGEDYDDDTDDHVEVEYKNGGRPVVPIPCGICNAPRPSQHFAHQECLDVLTMEYMTRGEQGVCPRCQDLQARACGSNSSVSSPFSISGGSNGTAQKFWCPNVVEGFPKGFVGSAKLNAVADFVQKVPVSDKILIVSFFKGSLDLMEAILVHELKWECARFDGDVSPAEKNQELDRFKNTPSCRVLLMTVQSGGVGLNISEGNHICFLDRWFNPFVHDQTEDRCHRLGQKKQFTFTISMQQQP